MADVQTQRHGRFLQAFFNLKDASTLGQSLPDAFPTISLDSPPPDYSFSAGIDLCRGFISVPAVAAQFGFAAVQLPTASGKIATITRMRVHTQGTTEGFRVGRSTGALGAAAPSVSQYVDTRRSGSPVCVLLRGNGAGAVLSNPNGALILGALESGDIGGPYVLGNVGIGGASTNPFVVIEGVTVNVAFLAEFHWTERDVEPQEQIP